jgi:sporulation protein YlmC with PRC-barrel domain
VTAREDFHLGAAVYSSDGKHVGSLKRILVEEADFELKALVLEESKVFSGRLLAPGSVMMEDDLVVPAQSVESTTHDRVELSLTAAQIRRLPPYLTYRRTAPSLDQNLQEFEATLGANPGIRRLREIAAKPQDEIEIDVAENVMVGHTGRKLGQVKDVLFDGNDLIGVVVDPAGLFKKPVVLPRRFLSRSDDLALFVDLNEEEINNLKLFKPTD